MRHLIALLAIGALLAGCSSASGQSGKPTGTLSYRDPNFHFSLQYPATWSIPKKGGHETSVSGVSTYVLPVKTPGNAQGIQVAVDRNLTQYATIPEGKVVPYGADSLHYHHLTVGGWPAIQIERYNKGTLDGIFTITNTTRYSYNVEMITGTPPFSSDALAGYHTIVKALKLPF